MLAAMLSQMQISTLGVTDGTEVAPGQVGELISASGSTIINSGASGVYTVVNSLYLSPGDWGIYANFWVDLTAVVGASNTWLMMTPATLPLDQTDGAPPGSGVAWQGLGDAAVSEGGTVGPVRMLTSTPIPCDLRGEIVATSGQASLKWAMTARRIR
jgi:hypothetical protein